LQGPPHAGAGSYCKLRPVASAKNHHSPLVQKAIGMPMQRPARVGTDISAGHKHTCLPNHETPVKHHRLSPAEFTATRIREPLIYSG